MRQAQVFLSEACLFVYNNSARGCVRFPQSPFPSHKEQQTLRHTRSPFKCHGSMNESLSCGCVRAPAVMWLGWAASSWCSGTYKARPALLSCTRLEEETAEEISRTDRRSLHDTAHITRISSTAHRATPKGNPLLLPFIEAPSVI